MTEKIQFKSGDEVKFELAPDGSTTRWVYDASAGWIDRGYSDKFLEGVITEITDDPFPTMLIEGTLPESALDYRITLPLEGHDEYVPDLYSFPGMPTIIFRDVSALECECGEDTAVTNGATPGRHSDWCKKYTPLSW